MENAADTRQAQLAVHVLEEGGIVTLQAGEKTVQIQSAELAPASAWQVPGASLILSGARAAWLGLTEDTEQAVRIACAQIDASQQEAMLSAARIAGRYDIQPAAPEEQAALMLVKAAGLLPAILAVPDFGGTADFALTAQALTAWQARPPRITAALPPVRLPLKQAEDARAAAFREESGLVHLAILIGKPEQAEAPLTRLHSSCITGDLLQSLRCDCGDQLQLALQKIAEAGAGVLLYLNQEGRGIGIFQKLRAYALQDAGLDTVDANRALGFADDERDFALAAEMLKRLDIPRIRLLTNNPRKAEALTGCGIDISERVALNADAHAHNAAYLATKRQRMGHS